MICGNVVIVGIVVFGAGRRGRDASRLSTADAHLRRGQPRPSMVYRGAPRKVSSVDAVRLVDAAHYSESHGSVSLLFSFETRTQTGRWVSLSALGACENLRGFVCI